MRPPDYIKAKLFEVAYKESGGKCGLHGEIVAWCLANRVRTLGQSWDRVLSDVAKYRAGDPTPCPDVPDFREPKVMKLLTVVDDVYDNASTDLSNSGVFYIFGENGCNDWFRDFVVKSGDYSQSAMQDTLRVYGPKIIIGKPYDPRVLGRGTQPW